MGWGIMGGSAVTEYTKQQQLARDNEWRDLQKQQLMDKMAQDKAQDDAVQQGAADAQNRDQGGSVVSSDLLKQTLPGIDDASAAQLAEQLSSADPAQASTILQQARQRFQKAPMPQGQPGIPSGPQMRTSTFGDQGQQQPNAVGDTAPQPVRTSGDVPATQDQFANLPTAPLRVYKGQDGKAYLTASAATPPSQGEIMMAQARRLLSGAAGFKGVQAGAMMQQQAVETMKLEQQKKLSDIMTGNMGFDQKVGALLGMVNGSAVTPGSVDLQKGEDGAIYAVHTVPGHKGDFKFKLNGGSPDEMLGDLAMRVQAMTNPDIMVKRLEMQQKDRQLADSETRTKQDAEQNAETARYHKDETALGYAGINSREKVAGMEVSARSADRADARAARAAAAPGAQKIAEINFIADAMMAAGEAKTKEEAVRKATLQVIHPMTDKSGAGIKVNPDGTIMKDGVLYERDAKGQLKQLMFPGDFEKKLPPPGANLFGGAQAAPAPAARGGAGISLPNPARPAMTPAPQGASMRNADGSYNNALGPTMGNGPAAAPTPAQKQQAAALLAEGQQEYTIAQRRMELAKKSLPANSPSFRTATMQAQGDMARALAKIQAAQATTQ